MTLVGGSASTCRRPYLATSYRSNGPSAEAKLLHPVTERGLAQVALLAKGGNGLLGLLPQREYGLPVLLPLRIATCHDGSPPTKKATRLPHLTRRPFTGQVPWVRKT